MKCDLLKPYRDFVELNEPPANSTIIGFFSSWALVPLLLGWLLVWESPSGLFLRLLAMLAFAGAFPVVLQVIKCYRGE